MLRLVVLKLLHTTVAVQVIDIWFSYGICYEVLKLPLCCSTSEIVALTKTREKNKYQHKIHLVSTKNSYHLTYCLTNSPLAH